MRRKRCDRCEVDNWMGCLLQLAVDSSRVRAHRLLLLLKMCKPLCNVLYLEEIILWINYRASMIRGPSHRNSSAMEQLLGEDDHVMHGRTEAGDVSYLTGDNTRLHSAQNRSHLQNNPVHKPFRVGWQQSAFCGICSRQQRRRSFAGRRIFAVDEE